MPPTTYTSSSSGLTSSDSASGLGGRGICLADYHQSLFREEGLTRLLLLVELSAWTSCLSNFTETEMGVRAGPAGDGSSTRSSFTIVSEAMTVSSGVEAAPRLSPWFEDKM